jgi:hypothetical protein
VLDAQFGGAHEPAVTATVDLQRVELRIDNTVLDHPDALVQLALRHFVDPARGGRDDLDECSPSMIS